MFFSDFNLSQDDISTKYCSFLWQMMNSMKFCFGRLGLDRGRLWRHFASRTFSEDGLISVRIRWFCVLLCVFFCFFDLTCTFQVPCLAGTCLLYVKDLDLYPKCPACCDLSRNVSICCGMCACLWSNHPALSWSLDVWNITQIWIFQHYISVLFLLVCFWFSLIFA